MPKRFRWTAGAAGLLAVSLISSCAAANEPVCETGAWVAPGSTRSIDNSAVIAVAATAPVVLLGEVHDNVEHHRWQYAVVAGLLGKRDDLVLGFEAFPREVQPALDRWVTGELSEAELLDQVAWWENWGFDPDLYTPLLHLARLHRIPVVALNVDRSLVSRVADEGWQAIPEGERRGLGDPAPASAAYLDMLAASFSMHASASSVAADDPAVPTQGEIRADPAFQRFVDAQLTWDRAMAEAISEARSEPGSPLVVGIIGSGHLRERHGVPAQLIDLGVEDAMVLLPQDGSSGCRALTADYADAVFVLDDAERGETARPRLGVALENPGTAVTVTAVTAGSIAAAAGFQPGDVILQAAGAPISTVPELIKVVQQQPAGTWLPVEVQRDGRSLVLVAKFPEAPSLAS